MKSAVETLKAKLRAAIGDDDWDRVERLLDIKRPRVQPVAMHTLFKAPDAGQLRRDKTRSNHNMRSPMKLLLVLLMLAVQLPAIELKLPAAGIAAQKTKANQIEAKKKEKKRQAQERQRQWDGVVASILLKIDAGEFEAAVYFSEDYTQDFIKRLEALGYATDIRMGSAYETVTIVTWMEKP